MLESLQSLIFLGQIINYQALLMQPIHPPSQPFTAPHPLLNLGFRIFFSGGGLFAIITMLLWAFVYMGKTQINASFIPPFYWHAHEMLYGYALAIIAGFLLTAVKTWTGVMMPYGLRLLGIFSCWAMARLLWVLLGLGIGVDYTTRMLLIAMSFDLLFMLLLAYAVFNAVLQVKQYKQMGILAKIALLTVANLLCYLGLFSHNIPLTKAGLYVGFYLIIGLVLTIGRRVLPFFIARGVTVGQGVAVNLKNSTGLDRLSLLFFLLFFIADVFYPNKILLSVTATSVAVVNTCRLVGWYHPGIWQKPLLWSLYLAFIGICISFILYALQPWFGFSHSLAVHALAIAGIGMMTVAMMARVSLGHTGRNIHAPPTTVGAMFGLMLITFALRVLMPLLAPNYYLAWIMAAQTAWILCFVVFCISYLPILAQPRTDGLFG